MNDLDLVREFRADIGGPTPEQLAAGRERLAAGIRRSARAPQFPHRSWGVWRPSERGGLHARYFGAALGAGVASVAAILALQANGTPTGPPSSGPQIQLADQVLRAAASSVASQATTRPDARQWIYSSFVARTMGQRVQRDEAWTRFDGRRTAYLQEGHLVVHTSAAPSGLASPEGAYAALATLPPQPRAMLRAVDREVAENPSSVAPPGSSPIDHHQTRQQLEFQFLTQRLWEAAQAAPARAESAVFRALAKIPGVTAHRGITDAVGRPAIALSDAGDEQQLLLDPRTYAVIGLRTISDGTWPMNVMASGPGRTYPRGTVIESDAWAKVALVSQPGER